MAMIRSSETFKSLSGEVLARVEEGESKEKVCKWAYEALGCEPETEALLWWCHALAGLWVLALTDSELFPDLEYQFSSALESAVGLVRGQRNRKDLLLYPEDTELLETNALWFQAQLLHFFWSASSLSSDQSRVEIAQIESLGKLILSLLNESDNPFFSQLAFPPDFVSQDWGAFLESRIQNLKAKPRASAKPLRTGQKLTQVLAKRWSVQDSDFDRRLG
jgi:hypothetical protein